MQETDVPGPNHEVSTEPSEAIAEIYSHNPTPEDQEVVRRVKEGLLDPSDTGNVRLFKHLRHSLEDLETSSGWRKAKDEAAAKLSQVQPDSLEKILVRFRSFIESLPAGHGKGHMMRDFVNQVGILNDPELNSNKIDEIELIAGMFGGGFHDDSASIIERYIDDKSVGAHAEVSAVLFEVAAKDILPDSLIRLIQYAIAAHTHYPTTRNVEISEDQSYSKHTYNDVTGGREAIWLARQSDRRDMSNFAQLVRDMIIHVTPIQDFDGEKHYDKLPPEENFAVYYGLSPEGQQIIKHEMMYCQNVYKFNAYTSHDSQYFTDKLMTPSVGDLVLFLSVVAPDKRNELLAGIEQSNPEAANQLRNDAGGYADSVEKYSKLAITNEVTAEAIGKFKHLCRVIEPAANLEEALQKFEYQFPNLSTEDQASWTRGMLFMSDVLYDRWRNRLADSVSEELNLGSKISSRDPTVQQQFEEIGRHLQSIAQQIIASMDEANSRP